MLTGINIKVCREKKHTGGFFSFLKCLNISKCYISLEEKTITKNKIRNNFQHIVAQKLEIFEGAIKESIQMKKQMIFL